MWVSQGCAEPEHWHMACTWLGAVGGAMGVLVLGGSSSTKE